MTARAYEGSQRDVPWSMAVAAVTVMALYALLLRRYSLFGPVSDTLSQLPVIMHLMDPQVLAADWYTQSMSGFSARYFYFQAMATLAGWIGIAPAFLLVQAACLIAVANVTLFGAVKAFGTSRVAGALAGMLAVAVSAFTLGNAAEVARNTLVPRSVATPIGLFAMILVLRGSYLRSAAVGVLGSLAQPVYGLLPAALTLLSVAIVRPWRHSDSGVSAHSAIPRLLLALLILVGVATWWSGLAGVDVGDDEAVRIVAFLRNPHHFRFALQPLGSWVLGACMLIGGAAMTIAWRRLEPVDPRRDAAIRTMLVACALIGLLGVVGFIAIEIVPSKLGLGLQPMRYVYLLLWLCLIPTAAVAGHFLCSTDGAARWGWSFSLLGGNAWAQPVLVLLGSVAALGVTRPSENSALDGARAGRALLGVALLMSGLALAGGVKVYLLGCGWLVAALGLWLTGRPLREAPHAGLLLAPVLGLGVVGFVVWGLPTLSPERFAAVAAFQPDERRITERAEYRDPGFFAILDVSRRARELSSEDAVFLTPPNFAPFRVAARRAIVVDFKAWTFRTPGAWVERIRDCYGDLTEVSGFGSMRVLEDRYREIDDARIQELAARYGATHAVLYRESQSSLPILYENDDYRIVSLQAAPGAG